MLLAIVGEDLAVVQNQTTVVKQLAVQLGITEHQMDAGDACGDDVHCCFYPRVQAGTKQEVFGRITGDGEFRHHHQVSAFSARTQRAVDDDVAITGDVTDTEIGLRQREAEGDCHG